MVLTESRNVLIFCAQFAGREMSWVSISHCVFVSKFQVIQQNEWVGVWDIEGWMFSSTFLP